MSDTSSGPLAFAQQMYFIVQQRPPSESVPVWHHSFQWPVPGGSAFEDVIAALRVLVRRHPALRTTYRDNDRGRASQFVHGPDDAAGNLAVHQVDADVDLAELRSAGFDLARPFPVRFVLRGGNEVVCVAHHITLDGAGAHLLNQEFAALLNSPGAGGASTGVAAGRGMLDIAEAERRPAVRNRSNRALQYWDRVIGSTPCRVDASATGTVSPFTRTICRSAEAKIAVHTLSHRLRVSQNVIVLAAYVHVLSAYFRLPRFCMAALCANRLTELDKVTVGCLQQLAVLEFDLTDVPDFKELTRRCAHANLVANVHGRYDSYDWTATLRSHGYDYPYIDNWIVYNFLAHTFAVGGGDPYRFAPKGPRWESYAAPVQLPAVNLTVWSEVGDLSLALTANGSVMSNGEMEGFLAEMQRTLLQAAD